MFGNYCCLQYQTTSLNFREISLPGYNIELKIFHSPDMETSIPGCYVLKYTKFYSIWQNSFFLHKNTSPYYKRQTTLCLHDLCQEVLTLHGDELPLFLAQGFPPILTIDV